MLRTQATNKGGWLKVYKKSKELNIGCITNTEDTEKVLKTKCLEKSRESM